MSDKFFQAKAYLSYWLDAVDEHSLHSPFFFDFYTRVVKKSNSASTGNPSIENLRNQLLHDNREIKSSDPGSGATGKRTIRTIARNSLASVKQSSLYVNIIEHFNIRTIAELGTSFGINTLYLASNKQSSVTTFEGSADIADIAKLTFEFANASNVHLIEGDLDSTWRTYLQSVRHVDFVLMDANHRFEPTLRYFETMVPKLRETSVVIVDDIHYTAEMEKAWERLKMHKLVYGSADLYRCGILFFDPSLNKQHVILQV